MKHLLVRHRVNDFAQWKRIYELVEQRRAAFGLVNDHIFQALNDPQEVFVMLDIEDETRARQFLEGPEIKEFMKQSGVAEEPDIFMFEDAA